MFMLLPLLAAAQDDGELTAPAAAVRQWDAAVGMVASYGPDYPGASRQSVALTPGLALRWGRVSVSSRSAFAVRSSDPGAQGGLRVDLLGSERYRVSLSLRVDGGRQVAGTPELAGLDDVRRTLRARISLAWFLPEHWRLGAAVTVDALGRGRGPRAEVSLSRGFTLTPHTHLGVGAALHAASGREMQAWFGVTPEQADRSGYPAFSARGGLRELTLSTGLRTELNRSWAVFQGVGVSRLLGSAARSPLTRQRDGWGLNAGVVYRF